MVKKTIQVLLKQNIKTLGVKGDVKTVTLGYARNYLIPLSYATKTTPFILKQAEKEAAKLSEAANLLKQEKLQLKTSLEQLEQVSVKRQVGQNNMIFGSVSAKDIAKCIDDSMGVKIDKKNITTPIIESIGEYEIQIDLAPDISACLKLQVLPE
uniref:ribosomal protein L9 n=1 Tax=Timspurckia oligopyrenoides TaxID=708627 RepID=UPI001FCE09F6|nr:ribosomal protein L9 [Timspurckia oligopyrenoides]UNJ17524.1 ribosomal protein L9 [Timspurckia oligopyrenoides]